MRFNLQEGFPLVTTKRCHLRSIIHELLWFLQGDTNIAYLHENNVTIWDEWADENGDLGPVYGKQWRSWPAPDGRHIDQISTVMEQLKTTPTLAVSSCRHGTSVSWIKWRWRRATRSSSSTSPTASSPASCISAPVTCSSACRSTSPAMRCWCIWWRSSAICKWAILSGPAATLTCTAITEQTNLQLSREPRPLPKLVIKRKPASIFDYRFEDFEIEGYDPHPGIKAPVAI